MYRWTHRVATLLLIVGVVGCQPNQHKKVVYGTIERERIILTAVDDKTLVKILVAEGDQVKQGDVLVELSASSQQLRVDEAVGNLGSAQARLSKLENGARREDVAAARAKLLAAQSTLELQEKNFPRLKKLVKSGNVSKATFDEAQASYDHAAANLNNLREELLKLTNGSRPEDILEAAAQVDASKARVKIAESDKRDLQIVATRDGRVETLPWHVGERVSIGAPVVILLSGKAPFVRTYLPQPYRLHIHVGDELQVTVDGLPDTIQGTVRKIATQPSYTPYYALNPRERSRLVYLTEIQLPEKFSQLPSGLPAEVVMP